MQSIHSHSYVNTKVPITTNAASLSNCTRLSIYADSSYIYACTRVS